MRDTGLAVQIRVVLNTDNPAWADDLTDEIYVGIIRAIKGTEAEVLECEVYEY